MQFYWLSLAKYYGKLSVRTGCTVKILTIFERVKKWKRNRKEEKL